MHDCPYLHAILKTGEALQTRRPVIVKDLSKSIDKFRFYNELKKVGINSVVILPLRGHENKIFGSISIYSKELDGFDQKEINNLKFFADQVAISLQQQEKNMMFAKLSRFNKELLAYMGEDIKELFDKIVGNACELIGASCGHYYPYAFGEIAKGIGAYGLKNTKGDQKRY